MKELRIYEYSRCSTCRTALKFLDRKKIPYQKVAIIDTPPTKAELKQMLRFQGGNMKKLFNTSGQAYREGKVGEKLAAMPESEAIALLASNGKLVKRPFLLTGDTGLVGFKEDEWTKALKS
jgi:arsenate reductase